MTDRFVVEPNTKSTKKLFPFLVRFIDTGQAAALLTDEWTANLLAKHLNAWIRDIA